MVAFRALLLGVLMIISSSGFAQKVEQVKKAIDQRSYKRLDSLLQKITHQDKGTSYYQVINRQIVSSYSAISLGFSEAFSSTQRNYYRINLLVGGDSIIYCRIINRSRINDPFAGIDFRDAGLIKAMQKKYAETFDRGVDSSYFFLEDVWYGYECGLGSDPPLYRRKFDSIINPHMDTRKMELDSFLCSPGTKIKAASNRLYKFRLDSAIESIIPGNLDGWLYSPVTELQVYAVEGFFYLKQWGFKLSSRELQWINYVKNKKETILFCYGCLSKEVTVYEATKDFKF